MHTQGRTTPHYIMISNTKDQDIVAKFMRGETGKKEVMCVKLAKFYRPCPLFYLCLSMSNLLRWVKCEIIVTVMCAYQFNKHVHCVHVCTCTCTCTYIHVFIAHEHTWHCYVRSSISFISRLIFLITSLHSGHHISRQEFFYVSVIALGS